jgi:hypothetical protein
VHVPVPLVIVKRFPAFVQAPLAEKETGKPDVLSAATVNAVLKVAVAGAAILTTIVCGVVPAAALAGRVNAATANGTRRVTLTCASLPRAAGERISRSLQVFVPAVP